MLDKMREQAQINHVPIVREQTGLLLCRLCEKFDPQNILEIGTAIGYSGALMLSACEGDLTTIEKDEHMLEIATKNFQECGLETRVELLRGDAKEELSVLLEKKRRFDFVFLDGPKAQYVKYLPIIKALLKKGGILFADDIYFHGMVNGKADVNPKKRSIVKALQAFNETLRNDADFEVKFLDIEDGIAIAKIKN